MSIEIPRGEASFTNKVTAHAEAIFCRQHSEFPKNVGAFFWQMVRQMPNAGLDLAAALNDFARAYWDYKDLYQNLRNGQGEGLGDGSTIIILKGFGANDEVYRGSKDYFEREGFRVIIAHSESPINIDPISSKKRAHLRLIEKTTQQTGSKVHLFSHSQGAIESSVLYAEHPEVIEPNVASIHEMGGPKPEADRANPVEVNIFVGIAYLWSQLVHGENDFGLSGLLESLSYFEAHGTTPIHSFYNPSDPFLRRGKAVGIAHATEVGHCGGAANLVHLRQAARIMRESGTCKTQKIAA